MRYVAGRADPKLVRQKLAGYLADCEAAGIAPADTTHEFYRKMEDRVPLGMESLTQWQARDARSRFQQQVLRELNLLADQGLLVKRGDRRNLHFYTPAAAQAADMAEAQRRMDADTTQAREHGIWERLEAIGLEPLVRSGTSIRLDTGDWEALVALAEKGKAAS